MLSRDLAHHAELQHQLGFKFRVQHTLLKKFVAFAERHGDQRVRSARVLEWATLAPSPQQSRNRLLAVRRFALALSAEDSHHEVPAADTLGRGLIERRIPHIYIAGEITALMQAAASLKPAGSIRPLMYETLFGLLAAAGMRISEALALQLDDVTDDGLIIRQTKFKKRRLLPLHRTTSHALDRYLAARRGGLGQRGPRIHDLRHTFAVRSLEQCLHDRDAVARHIVALSTYLGHAHVTDTYWNLQATPILMTQIAAAGEALHQGAIA